MFIILTLILFFCAFLKVTCVYAKDFTKETIYFILIDRFLDGDPSNNPTGKIYSPDKSEWKLYWGGDLQGITDRLPYIKSLGATAIWITPVVENPEDLYIYGTEKISAYHGYWGKDFKRINPYFGSMETFDKLVKTAHEMGIKVILDFVLNHTSPCGQGCDGAVYDNGVLKGTYSNDPNKWFHHNGTIDFTILNEAEWEDKSLFDLTDFNHDTPDVDTYLKEAALMWLSHGIDGFRIDTARHIPCKYMKSFAHEIYSKKDVFIFGEWSFGNFKNELDREFALKGIIKFDRESDISVIDFNFLEAIRASLAQNKSFKLIADALKLDEKLRDPCSMVTCVDNHDMPRFISTAIAGGATESEGKKKFEMAIYLIMTSRGIPCIYYGSEQFLHNDTPSTWGVGGEPYNRQMMNNFSTDGKFFKNINKLALLRQDNPAISRGIQKTLFLSDDIYVYERELNGNFVIVAMNKGKRENINVSTSLPDGIYNISSNKYKKILGRDIKVKEGKVTFKLNQYEVGIWSFVKEVKSEKSRGEPLCSPCEERRVKRVRSEW
jgi:cyclomaltodextrin glucanotransferase